MLNKRVVANTGFTSLIRSGATIDSDKYARDAFIVQFVFGGATTTFRIVFNDPCGADLVITNMTTLPLPMMHRGFGSLALRQLLSWAKCEGIGTIQAVQIREENERFWMKHKFVKIPEPNPCNDFQLEDH